MDDSFEAWMASFNKGGVPELLRPFLGDTLMMSTVTGATLSSSEILWSEHYDWLSTLGYELRPRFRPGCVPSYSLEDLTKEFTAEDAFRQVSNYIWLLALSDNSLQ